MSYSYRPSLFDRALVVLMMVSFIVGLLGRYNGLFGDLWLDEIWSVLNVRTLSNSIQIFTELHHDNNHLLNSLAIYFTSPNAPAWWYRVPSTVFGFLSLLGWIALSRDSSGESSRISSSIAVALFSLSAPIIIYSSEARGYSLMILCSICAIWSIRRASIEHKSIYGILFSVAATVGILAHLTSLFVLCAAFLWFFFTDTNRESLRVRAVQGVGIFSLPFAIFAYLYWNFYRLLPPSFGNTAPIWYRITNSISLSYGGPILSPDAPQDTLWAMGLASLVVVFVVTELYLLLREGDGDGLLYSLLILVVPIGLLLLHHSNYLSERYLLVPLLFSYLIVARFLTRLSEASFVGKAITLIILCTLIFRGSILLERLLNFHRGGYSEALELIINESPAGPVTVAGDHDFRQQIVIDFLRPSLPDGERLRYVESQNAEQETPLWFIAHHPYPEHRFPAELKLGHASFHLRESYPFTVLSGFSWGVYRRAS